MEEKIINIISDYFNTDPEELSLETHLTNEYYLNEDDFINLADIIVDQTGHYISPDIIEEAGTIGNIIERLEE